MFLNSERSELREQFFLVFNKLQLNQTLSPLEKQLAHIIEQHSEYHYLLEEKEKNLDRDFSPEKEQSNPFLHMALHQAILEQVSTNRPKGIQTLYQKACQQMGSAHDAEHLIMEALAECLWQIQRYQTDYSDDAYIKLIKKQFKKAGIR